MDCFARWGTAHIGLFTFPHSPKHLYLCQTFGFWPRFLVPIMAGRRALLVGDGGVYGGV